MSWFKSLFSESSDVSMTRFLSFVCVISATLIAVYGVLKGSELSTLSVLCGTFLGAGFGGKVVQKFAEIKTELEK